MQDRDQEVGAEVTEAQGSGFSRRNFLKLGSGAAAAAATLTVDPLNTQTAQAAQVAASSPARRRVEAFHVRAHAALHQLQGRPPAPQPCNGDEARYPDQRASFHKGLPQNAFGEVSRSVYAHYVRALGSRDPDALESVPLAPQADRKLVNPQAAYAFTLSGLDGQLTRIDPAPAFASAEAAAEMGEVYWQALARDVPFQHYGSSPLIAAAVQDLNGFSHKIGPTDTSGQISTDTVFRGETPGDLAGPFISQFLWVDIPFGPSTVSQRYNTPVAGDDFMTGYSEWLNIQRGAAPSRSITFDGTPRYIRDLRGMGEYVHKDALFQAYLNAAFVLLSYGPGALAPENPYLYSANQGGFATFGAPQALDLVTRAGNMALKGAWFQKWLVHRRLRPEAFGGRLHLQRTGQRSYDIHPDLISSAALPRVYQEHSTYLLPQAFPEGSPMHPSYVAGHAAVAGSCVTVLKAFFNEDFVIPAPVEATADGLHLDPWSGGSLTVGGELNKLAANISLGRDAAGVHYRSDGIDGISVGEQQAIALLQDYSLTSREFFEGFTLTRFDGQRIQIADGHVAYL